MSPQTPPIAVRIRVGIAHFDDGWNVIVRVGEKTLVYDPTLATEAEAEILARKVATDIAEANR